LLRRMLSRRSHLNLFSSREATNSQFKVIGWTIPVELFILETGDSSFVKSKCVKMCFVCSKNQNTFKKTFVVSE